MKFGYLMGLGIVTSLVVAQAEAKTNATRKPANEIVSSAGVTKDMQDAIEKHWMFKPIKNHYKTFAIYGASLETNSEDTQHSGDKTVTIMYSTYIETEKDAPEDSVSFTAGYDSKKKTILNMTVTQGPCMSDMCGP
jgi:hypothetical protein